VQQLASSYIASGCNMSLKPFSACPFEFFPENMEDLSDEHGEKFHQDISHIEKRCSGKQSSHVLADYYWSLIRETPTGEYKGQKKMHQVYNGFFCSEDTVHREIFYYLTVHVVMKKQYITIYYKLILYI
jgi:hypothetical protein